MQSEPQLEALEATIEASGKEIHVEASVGVQACNFERSRIKPLGWRMEIILEEGIAETYAWIGEQVEALEG